MPLSNASRAVISKGSKSFSWTSCEFSLKISFSICENLGVVLSLGSKNISASAWVNSLSLITPCLGDISFLYAFPS